MTEYLFLALVLACPLMMILMIRGHGHGVSHGRPDHAGRVGCGHGGHSGQARDERVSLDALRRQRDELDDEIAKREWQGTSSGGRSAELV